MIPQNPTKVFCVCITVLTFAALYIGRAVIHRQTAFMSPGIGGAGKKIYQCKSSWETTKIDNAFYEQDSRVKTRAITETDYIPPLLVNDPQITLDRRAYLLPYLVWGPNNQLVGAIESVFVAIKLNRTFVLPRFMKHHTDKQVEKGLVRGISPLHRIDVAKLCKYISCIALDEMQRACNHRINGILNIRYLSDETLDKIENDIGMTIRQATPQSSTEAIYIPVNGTTKQNTKLLFAGDEITGLFSSEAKCVLYPYPLYNIRGDGRNQLLYRMISPQAFREINNTSSNIRLMANILKNTPRPKYIRKLADEFTQFMRNGSTFLSSHWRYNKGDYLSPWHCGLSRDTKKSCEIVRNYTSQKFAQRLDAEISSLSGRNLQIDAVYIASPRTEVDFIISTSQHLTDLRGELRIFSSRDMETFMKGKLETCHFLARHFEDILSSVEMEVCSKSVAFLGSWGSSWTDNVFVNRMQLDEQKYAVQPSYIFNI